MSRPLQMVLWSVVSLVVLSALVWLTVATDQWAWLVGGVAGGFVGLMVGLRWRRFYAKVGREAARDHDELRPPRSE